MYGLGLMKKLLIIAAMLTALAFPARAQQGVVQIQANTQALFPTAPITCPFSQTFNVQNENQTVHVVTYSAPATAQTINIFIEGSSDGVTFFQLSNNAMTNGPSQIGALIGYGFYPIVRVNVTIGGCTGSPNFTLAYNSAGTTPAEALGAFDQTALSKVIANNIDSTVSHIFTLAPPYGNLQGNITFQYTGTPGVHGQLTLENCDNAIVGAVSQNFVAAALSVANVQSFAVRAFPSSCVELSYTPGTGGTGGMTISYNFTKPGGAGGAVPVINARGQHISGVTTVQSVKNYPGVLHSIVIGTPAVGTVTVFDLGIGDCTGTPSTFVNSVITLTSSSQPQTILFDKGMDQGICILPSSATMDLTVLYN
jgi:hypothetical protein